MSVRRFLAYFLAVTAGSTVVFASFLSAPGKIAEEMALQAAREDIPPSPEGARMLQYLRERPRHRTAAKPPQIALAEYRLGN